MIVRLDLSESKVSKVSLTRDGKVIDELVGGDTLALIDELLKKHSLKLSDLEKVESYPGPGSFTGIKVAAAIANALNFSLGKIDRSTPRFEEEKS